MFLRYFCFLNLHSIPLNPNHHKKKLKYIYHNFLSHMETSFFFFLFFLKQTLCTLQMYGVLLKPARSKLPEAVTACDDNAADVKLIDQSLNICPQSSFSSHTFD